MSNDNAQLEANKVLTRRWFEDVINQRVIYHVPCVIQLTARFQVNIKP